MVIVTDVTIITTSTCKSLDDQFDIHVNRKMWNPFYHDKFIYETKKDFQEFNIR